MNVIKENDLYDYGLKIYQCDTAFKFSLDSILLGEFVDIKFTTKKIFDMCTGNCSIPLLLSTKTKAKIYCMEIQKDIYELGNLSIATNNLEKQITLINDDINNSLNHFESEYFDIITINPPYFKYQKDSIISIAKEKAIARYEINIKMEEYINLASSLLKNKGSLYIVHRPERLMELIRCLDKYKLSVNKIQFIYTNKNKNASMVLIEAIKNGKSELKVSPPILIEDQKSYKNIFK